jgi:recombination protein RecR
MSSPSEYLDALIKELASLPGIGHKSAARAAFKILDMNSEESNRLLSAIDAVLHNVKECTVCRGISDGEVCSICNDTSRNAKQLCVVEHKKDVLTIERSGFFSGLYHVLGGVISPLDGIGPDELSIELLYERCKKNGIDEIIMATNPTVEGDATIIYISDLVKDLGVKVMRLARGLPVGADIDFADSATIAKSFKDRHEY